MASIISAGTSAGTAIAISGDTSGNLAFQTQAGANTITLPNAAGVLMVSGNMPTFSYYQSSAQTLSSGTATKITFTSNDWDTTSGMFASSRFTPTVAGYYQITGGFEVSAIATGMLAYVYKNGSQFKKLTNIGPATGSGVAGSALVYCNGSTDYIEFYGLVATGQALVAGSATTYFQGVLVRTS
jgi:hypothetical protein